MRTTFCTAQFCTEGICNNNDTTKGSTTTDTTIAMNTFPNIFIPLPTNGLTNIQRSSAPGSAARNAPPPCLARFRADDIRPRNGPAGATPGSTGRGDEIFNTNC